jgi:hypothetical protein
MPSKNTARMGMEGEAVGRGGAGGFAVCGFSATLAKYFGTSKRRWLTAGWISNEDIRVSA